MSEELIKSISYDQNEIIKNIISLYVPSGKIDCDPTYSKGVFYNNTGIEIPEKCFDIDPKYSYVKQADVRNLPIESRSLNCVMFDPPFLATTGKSLQEENCNVINKRFGVYPNYKELFNFYSDSLKELSRVLKDDGILIFKCQDTVCRTKHYMSHVFVMNEAIKSGFYPEDLFILLAKSRIVADWQKKNQKHARKFHCYFWVFRKSDKIIEYL